MMSQSTQEYCSRRYAGTLIGCAAIDDFVKLLELAVESLGERGKKISSIGALKSFADESAGPVDHDQDDWALRLDPSPVSSRDGGPDGEKDLERHVPASCAVNQPHPDGGGEPAREVPAPPPHRWKSILRVPAARDTDADPQEGNNAQPLEPSPRCKGKTFRCSVCAKVFNHKGNCLVHERTHSDIKRFGCAACFRTFSRFCHLQSHMLLHTGKRPFQCEHCELNFRDSSNLNRHRKRHDDVGDNECDVCRLKFSTVRALKIHMKVHRRDS